MIGQKLDIAGENAVKEVFGADAVIRFLGDGGFRFLFSHFCFLLLPFAFRKRA